MRILPFVGTRYRAAGGDPGRLAAPPFDQIDDRVRSRLHREPNQFAHLTRPDPRAAEGPQLHAAALHRSWLAEGVVGRDGKAGLYPYEVLLADGRRRLGLAGLVGLEPPDAGVVQPHEQTVVGTVAERLELLRATGCDLEPILLLADDQGELDQALTGALESLPQLAEHRDAGGHRHRLYQPLDAAVADGLRRSLAERSAIIADGHHRWEVASQYAAEVAAGPEDARAAKLAVVTSLGSPGITIDPIHRGLEAALDPGPASALAADRLPWLGDGGASFARAVADAAQPAVGVLSAGGAEIWRLSPDSRLTQARAALAVCRLHEEVLPRLGLTASATTDGTVIYRSNPGKLWSEVGDGRLGLGFFLPPMRPEEFARAVAGGGVLPPKSTRFLPKLASGLVWAEHGVALGG